MNKIDKKAVSFINAVMKNERYEELYDAIRESEQKTRSVLLDFDKKYPGVVGESIIDSVIENADRKSEDKVSVRATLERFTNEQKPTKQKTENDRDER